jgi:trigger factor
MDIGETKTFDVTSVNFNRSDFNDPEKTETFTFTVTILEIQKRVIPAITDEWVEKNIPGASTVPELREEIREQGLSQRERELDNMKTFLAASEFARRFKGSIPDELYELTRDDILRNLQQNVQAQGKTMQEFIDEQGGGEQQFSMQLMLQTREVLTQGFSLDALARHLKFETTDEDIKETFRIMAPGHEREAQMEFELTGRMYQIYEAALRNKANKWLVDNAEIEYMD